MAILTIPNLKAEVDSLIIPNGQRLISGSDGNTVLQDIIDSLYALIGNFSFSGTQNYVAKFDTTSSIGDSQIFDNGTNVGINTTNFTNQAKLKVQASTSGLGNKILSLCGKATGNIENEIMYVQENGYSKIKSVSGGCSIECYCSLTGENPLLHINGLENLVSTIRISNSVLDTNFYNYGDTLVLTSTTKNNPNATAGIAIGGVGLGGKIFAKFDPNGAFRITDNNIYALYSNTSTNGLWTNATRLEVDGDAALFNPDWATQISGAKKSSCLRMFGSFWNTLSNSLQFTTFKIFSECLDPTGQEQAINLGDESNYWMRIYNNGAIKTGDIGATAAPKIKLGTEKTTSGATVNSTRYVEYEFDGTIIKLAVLN